MAKLGQVLKHDRYCRAIDLRANLIPSITTDFIWDFSHNERVLCLDLRDNKIKRQELVPIA